MDYDNFLSDVTYAKLDPIFQGYLMSETDAGIAKYFGEYTNKCADSCDARNDFFDICRSLYCFQHNKRRCSGKVHDCRSTAPSVHVCLAVR